jgi:hypothetical protein
MAKKSDENRRIQRQQRKRCTHIVDTAQEVRASTDRSEEGSVPEVTEDRKCSERER